MQLSSRLVASAAVLAAAIVPVFAVGQRAGELDAASARARLAEIAALRASFTSELEFAELAKEYDELCASLRDAAPARTDRVAQSGNVAALSVPPTCGGTPVTGSFSGTTGPIGSPPMETTSTFTANVSGLDTYLWDVNLITAILHTDNTDIDMRLTSPMGTVVTITTDSTANDNVFNGTTWDDNVNDPVTDKTFTNLVAATPLSPEGRLQAFRGENPNGTWTLTIVDDLYQDVGTLSSWSLDIRTLTAAPAPTTLSFPKVSGAAIGPGVATVTDTVAVAGLGTFLVETELLLTIVHQQGDNLDITLTSPVGPAVKVTTDNGGVNDNVFNGTLWDVDAPTPVSDAVYVNLVTATPLSPEGAFDNWLGQDPNGNWTLTIVDDLASNGGTLVDWTLNLTTIPAPAPSAPANFAGTTGPIGDATPNFEGLYVFTCAVGGMPASIWDVDLTTTLPHTWCDDLDITLQSPAGTTVVITTDNAGTNDDVYNGTLWDDNVNDPVTDAVYVNLVTKTPLSPEGRLAAFRGENPNGTWTLSVFDDGILAGGSLNNWTLDIAALPASPPQVSTTFSQSPALPISTSVVTVSDTIAVAGLTNAITEVEVYVEIVHAQADHLDITLTSPATTAVKLTTDNGGANDNVYNGTLFDPDVLVPVTDALYVNLLAAPALSPEGSFDNFVGQSANGNWTLAVADDTSTLGGTFTRWDLTIRTCGAPPPVPYCFGDGTGTACPCLPSPLVGDPDKGCPNSFNAGGGKLTATGQASISSDTLVMICTLINNGGAVVFQGTTDNGGGLGTAFGDGLRCAAGTVRRMRSHTVTTNTHVYPDPMFGDNAISIRGAVLAPGDRFYQGWYRSGLAHCNPTQNYNLTNAVKVTWVP